MDMSADGDALFQDPFAGTGVDSLESPWASADPFAAAAAPAPQLSPAAAALALQQAHAQQHA